MKKVEVRRIDIRPASLFSKGVGHHKEADGTPELIEFIGHTTTMYNILKDLEDFEDHPEHGPPVIYLEAWQEI